MYGCPNHGAQFKEITNFVTCRTGPITTTIYSSFLGISSHFRDGTCLSSFFIRLKNHLSPSLRFLSCHWLSYHLSQFLGIRIKKRWNPCNSAFNCDSHTKLDKTKFYILFLGSYQRPIWGPEVHPQNLLTFPLWALPWVVIWQKKTPLPSEMSAG